MKIARLRLWQVSGPASFGDDFWEERLVRPVDVYPEHRDEGIEILQGPDAARASSIFVELETDDGATGLGGPISLEEAFVIDRDLRPLIEGADALANERLWDRMYRCMVHGRKGVAMFAISAVDCAMWDLKGRIAQPPGPSPARRADATRDPRVRQRSGLLARAGPDRRDAPDEFVEDGYTAMKWFYRSGPADGERRDGGERGGRRGRCAAAVGPGVEIMTDAWMSLGRAVHARDGRGGSSLTGVRWIEEPVLPDKIAGYAEIRRASPVPIAGGEHEYTRWGIHRLLEAGAVDVLQPDIYWAGGITEMLKICALASTYDIPVIPHGHSVPATIHLVAALPESVTPLLEYLVKWNEVHQFFLREQLRPVNGWVAVPETPGLGIELDESKIENPPRAALERRMNHPDSRTAVMGAAAPAAMPGATDPWVLTAAPASLRIDAEVNQWFGSGPGWGDGPPVLPEGWSLGDVSGVASSPAGEVYAFQRGRSADPVLVYDRERPIAALVGPRRAARAARHPARA